MDQRVGGAGADPQKQQQNKQTKKEEKKHDSSWGLGGAC